MKDLKIMKRKEVELVTGLSRSSIYARIELGTFPKAIRLGVRAVGWLESEIQDWINKQIIATRGAESHEQ